MAHHPERVSTRDRGIPGEGMEVHTTEQLGPNMSKLPNGFLLCKNVPIARAGWLIYGRGEVPVKVGDNGVAYIERTIDTLINEKTIKSFNGAAVVNDHPDDDVDPTNWKKVSVGFTLNVRQGTGDDADVLLADLMITDKRAIDDVLSGKREVSAGYDALYRDDGGGRGRQFDLIGNHIALVQKGRCGPRCAIGDQDYQSTNQEENAMTTRVKLHGTTPRTRLNQDDMDTLRQKAQDAVAALEAAESGDEGDQHIHIHMDGAPTGAAATTDASTLDKAIDAKLAPVLKTLDAIAAKVLDKDFGAKVTSTSADDDFTADAANCEEKDDDTDKVKAKKKAFREARDKAAKDKGDFGAKGDPEKGTTGDSRALETGYQELMAQAEILAPGIKVPTFDAAATRATTVDRMCAVRRKALDAFNVDKVGAVLLKGLNGGADLDTVSMTCDAVATIFKSASVAKGALNNAAASGASGTAAKVGDAAATPLPHTGGVKVKPWAEINKAAADFWHPQMVKA